MRIEKPLSRRRLGWLDCNRWLVGSSEMVMTPKGAAIVTSIWARSGLGTRWVKARVKAPADIGPQSSSGMVSMGSALSPGPHAHGKVTVESTWPPGAYCR